VTEESTPPEAESEESDRMTFGEHLDELRTRMFRAMLVIGVMFLGGWTFLQDQLIWIFLRPHKNAVQALAERVPPIHVEMKLQLLDGLEQLFFTLKASLMVSMLLGLPFLIYQIWAFVSAGLHDGEKRAIRRYLPWSMLLSLGGIAFCYFIFFPFVLEYLYSSVDQANFKEGYQLSRYFGQYLMFTFALALVFQLPVLMSGMGAAGLVDAAFLRKYRRHFILVAFVIGAMLTPPEPMSQFLMALPTVLLFEIGILLVAAQGRKKRSREASENV
jgi:sec-independent protein translocase protein TatC